MRGAQEGHHLTIQDGGTVVWTLKGQRDSCITRVTEGELRVYKS